MNEIVMHDRLYGEEHQESMDWLPYLSQLSRKPKALKYTGAYNLLPEDVRGWIDVISPQEKSAALKMLADITKKSGFNVAVNSLEIALSCGVNDFESIMSTYRSIVNKIPALPRICLPTDVPELGKVDIDCKKYDRL